MRGYYQGVPVDFLVLKVMIDPTKNPGSDMMSRISDMKRGKKRRKKNRNCAHNRVKVCRRQLA
jgi:hypothetical protein